MHCLLHFHYQHDNPQLQELHQVFVKVTPPVYAGVISLVVIQLARLQYIVCDLFGLSLDRLCKRDAWID